MHYALGTMFEELHAKGYYPIYNAIESEITIWKDHTREEVVATVRQVSRDRFQIFQNDEVIEVKGEKVVDIIGAPSSDVLLSRPKSIMEEIRAVQPIKRKHTPTVVKKKRRSLDLDDDE